MEQCYNYELKIFYTQYEVSFLVSLISLLAKSDTEAIEESKKYKDMYLKQLDEPQYRDMPDTIVTLILFKNKENYLPITLGCMEINKYYTFHPNFSGSEF